MVVIMVGGGPCARAFRGATSKEPGSKGARQRLLSTGSRGIIDAGTLWQRPDLWAPGNLIKKAHMLQTVPTNVPATRLSRLWHTAEIIRGTDG